MLGLVVVLADSGLPWDINGDGLDEIGVFGIETGGQARGAWMQYYDGNGLAISSFFLGQGRSDVQIRRIDYDGNGIDEVAVLSTTATGGRSLEVRNAAGAVLASASVAEPGAERLTLFEIEADGSPPAEIGIGFSRPPAGTDPVVPWGPGLFQVWAASSGAPGGLVQTAFVEAIPGGFADHAWRVADRDGSAGQALVAGYALAPSLLTGEPTGHGAVARIWNPQNSTLLTEIAIADAAFDGAQWVVGDFVASNAGEEILVGLRRRTDSVGVARVHGLSSSPNSLPLAAFDATLAGASELAWRAIRQERPVPGPGQPLAPETHYVLAGFRQASGAWAYQVLRATVPSVSSEASPRASGVGAARSRGPVAAPRIETESADSESARTEAVEPGRVVGGGTVLGAEATVNDWLVGEFDADTANGDGIVVVFTRADRSIGFQHWGLAGFTQVGGATLFGPTYINPLATAIQAAQAGRDDVAIIVRIIDESPRLELWNVNGPGTRLMTQSVLGPDVR